MRWSIRSQWSRSRWYQWATSCSTNGHVTRPHQVCTTSILLLLITLFALHALKTMTMNTATFQLNWASYIFVCNAAMRTLFRTQRTNADRLSADSFQVFGAWLSTHASSRMAPVHNSSFSTTMGEQTPSVCVIFSYPWCLFLPYISIAILYTDPPIQTKKPIAAKHWRMDEITRQGPWALIKTCWNVINTSYTAYVYIRQLKYVYSTS